MDRDLEHLLGALREGVISPEELSRLEARINAEADVQQSYLEYMELRTNLRQHHAAAIHALAIAGSSPEIELTAGSSPWRRWLFRLCAAVLLVVALGALSIGFAVFRDGERPRAVTVRAPAPAIPATPGEGGTVAVLARAVQEEWDGTAPQVGSELRAGTLKLRRGIVQMEFFTGAVVVIEGPADFDLLSVSRIYCRQGKLRALVPPQAEGFAIDSPLMELVDRGTEFGFQVDAAGMAEIHVFRGRVELHGTAPGRNLLAKPDLTTGDGVRVDPTGGCRTIAADAGAFVGAAELERRLRHEQYQRRQEWEVVQRELRADPRVVLYYTFEEQPSWQRVVPNRAQFERRALDGAIIGCSWTAGRLPGTGALDFKRPSDRIRFHVPGTYTSLTFLAWVRVDAFEHRLNSLFLTDGFDEGEPHWQLTEDGKLVLGVRGPALEGTRKYLWDDYYSPVFLRPDRLGKWLQLATVFDRRSSTVIHYVDGQPVSRSMMYLKPILRIGDAEVGNWGTPTIESGLPTRNFNGRIDEFLLFGDALSPDEIHRLYEQGKPCS
jgi:hypothetical protein